MTLPPGWDLPPALFALLGDRTTNSGGRQRALVVDDNLLLILHKVPEATTSKREAVAFWRASGGEWRSSMGGNGLTMLRSHLEAYEKRVEELESALERADDAASLFHVIERAAPLARASTNALAAIEAASEKLPEARELVSLRDLAGDSQRGAELLHLDARAALDFQIARQNEAQSRSAAASTRAGNRLGLITAFFLPLTALSGVFGMNLPSGLEGSSTSLFWGIWAFGALFGVGLGLLLNRLR